MRKAFALIELLIGIFVLSLALIAIAAVFAKTTRQVAQNFDEVNARSIRRSADSFYPHFYRENALVQGWNVETTDALSNDYKIVYLTYKMISAPDSVIVVAYQGKDAAYETSVAQYLPQNGDIVVSWYGFHHVVNNNSIIMQDFEMQNTIIVLPYKDMRILDVHKLDGYLYP